MGTFRFYPIKKKMSAHDIAAIKKACGLGISEIQRRVANHEWLIEIEWSLYEPETKVRLVSLLKKIDEGSLPLYVAEVSISDEKLSVAAAFERLSYLREIALEQDMIWQLEDGVISSEEEYEPDDEDDY